MAGLAPAIHVFLACGAKDVDARDKPGHDGELSAFQESQPDRRAGTASNTDGTARCGAQLLGSPPPTIAPGRRYAGAA